MYMGYKKILLVIALGFAFGVEVNAMQRKDNDKELLQKLYRFLCYDSRFGPKHSLDEYVSIMNQMKNINIAISEGDTALHLAVRSNRADVVKVLINRGANPNIKDALGLTPLMLAVEKMDVEIIKDLIRAKADVNMQSNSKATALLLAVVAGRPEVVKELILAGADIYIPHISNETPLRIAASIPNHVRPTEEITQIQTSMAKMILERATQLTREDKESIKALLIANNRLFARGQTFLPRDPKMLVVKEFTNLLPALLRERIIRAAALEVSNLARRNLPEVTQIIEQYLDPQFLEQRVRSQVGMP